MRVTERGRGGEERINRRMKIEERSREIGKEGRGEKERRKRSGRAEEREKRKGNIFKREMERVGVQVWETGRAQESPSRVAAQN